MEITITAELVGIFLVLAGYIIGLGAVTVIDMHGFLARKSSYWTQATVRTHKITKPLIWLGICLVVVGGGIFYSVFLFTPLLYIHAAAVVVLVANGCFLSFVVSPYLLEKEKQGADRELLPASLQHKITASFVVSIIGWWGSLAVFVYYLFNIFIN